MKKIELDVYMTSRGYSYINGECREDGTEYVRRYVHRNGISELSFTERFGKWVNCFQVNNNYRITTAIKSGWRLGIDE